MKTLTIIFIFISLSIFADGKKDSVLVSLGLANDSVLENGNHYFEIEDGKALEIHTFRIYFKIGNSKRTTQCDTDGYVLLDLNTIQKSINTSKRDFSTIGVGVDSLCHCSGLMERDLNPRKGMYWSWQSGFINQKIEGFLTDKNGTQQEFVYHLGGYLRDHLGYFELTNSEKKDKIEIEIDLVQYLNKIFEDSSTLQIMSPSSGAAHLQKELSNHIVIN